MQKLMVTFLVLLSFAGCKTARNEAQPISAAPPEKVQVPVVLVEAPPDDLEPDVVHANNEFVATEAEPSFFEGFGPIYFEFDSDILTEDAQSALDGAAQWLVENPSVVIRIEGHTDARGTSEYNLALGQRRSLAISTYLKHLGVRAEQLQTVSYGEELPAFADESEDAWALNRRGEIEPLDDAPEIIGAHFGD
ncbi:MAG: OmpA family protein [Myxococcota bacterium]